jgi:hypothetical protein
LKLLKTKYYKVLAWIGEVKLCPMTHHPGVAAGCPKYSKDSGQAQEAAASRFLNMRGGYYIISIRKLDTIRSICVWI